MAPPKGGTTSDGEGKKTKKNKPTSKKYSHYVIESGVAKKMKKSCPRCGPGIFLAEHDNRFYCGKCAYTEFKGKKADSVEEKKE
ncbi:30S ribosomal protein S27ae [Candidatus Pacearchaeota archaeon]|nr:30S ribosomal protein S27ae [Candidatus Pacearchaeota archaeon]|tara:strand:+ start:174 stop:425 length:252 start_codon:yes stop_codon:yes gene_type:complete